MTTREILGGTVIAILVIGLIYAAVSPAVSPAVPPEGKPVITEKTLLSATVPGVTFVNLNLTIKGGGVEVNFTDDENLVYRLRFEQDENVTAPTVEYGIVTAGVLPVNVFAESADLYATFGAGCTYNGTLRVGVGAISLVLSEHSNVDNIDAIVMYAGGLSVEVLNDASFNQLNLKIVAGGLRLRVDANNLRKSGSISTRIELGGIFIEPISTGPNLGISLTAFADMGGIALNPGNFVVEKQTDRECKIRTTNYPASTNLDIDIFLGLGGGMINQVMTWFPTFSQ